MEKDKISPADRRPQHLHQLIHERITEHGSALSKAPYLRKAHDEARPKLNPKEQGYGTLRQKLQQCMDDHGISLKQEKRI